MRKSGLDIHMGTALLSQGRNHLDQTRQPAHQFRSDHTQNQPASQQTRSDQTRQPASQPDRLDRPPATQTGSYQAASQLAKV